jgi:uncharacterized membrane protein YhhN
MIQGLPRNRRAAAFLYAFLLFLAADLLVIMLGQVSLRYFTKGPLIFFLAGYFVASISSIDSPLKKWILLALFFSWVGDVLLLFESHDSIFFLLGLSSFLLAHVFYIVFFHRVRIREAIKAKPVLLVIVLLYYGGLIYLISPSLRDMNLPVRIYAVIISFMFMLAMHMLFIRQRKAGLLMMLGSFFFVLSDSILAIDKFYHSFAPAGTLIMLTYGSAQLLITEGAIRYIGTFDSRN